MINIEALKTLKHCLRRRGFYATAVLPLATLLFKAFCEQRFARPTQSTALEDAVEADCLAEANDIELAAGCRGGERLETEQNAMKTSRFRPFFGLKGMDLARNSRVSEASAPFEDENYYVDPVLKEPQLRDAPELFGMSFGLLTLGWPAKSD